MRLATSSLLLALALLGPGCSDKAGDTDGGTPAASDVGTADPADAAEEVSRPDAARAGRDAGTDAGPKIYLPVPAADFCGKYAAAICARNARCRTADPKLSASCIASEQARCALGRTAQTPLDKLLVDALKTSRVAFDDKAAGLCVGLAGDLSCQVSALPAECAKVITGKVAPGGLCFDDVECASGGFCYGTSDDCPRKCFAYLTTVGVKCTGTSYGDQRCDPVKLRCDYSKGTTCQPRGLVGDECFSQSECTSGLVCDYNKNFTCQTAPAINKAGQPCNASSGPQCDPGSFCRAEAYDKPGTCQPRVAEGGSCTSAAQCQVPLYCNAGYSIGSCLPQRSQGEKCDGYSACRDDLYCDENDTFTCKTYPKVGESCDGVYRCSEGSCDFTRPYTCKALKKLGEACSYDSQCVTARCALSTLDGDGGTVSARICTAACAPAP